jgi:hypothetical protein
LTATHRVLVIDRELFTALSGELARRGDGRRESGAFLLAPAGQMPDRHGRQRVTAVAYYDDLEPGCLTGGISFTANGYTQLAALCRQDGLSTVADIHTHPARCVAQSPIDAANPMTALNDHVALIAPCYARAVTSPSELGVHILGDDGRWTSLYSRDAARAVSLDGRRLTPADLLQAATRCLARLTGYRRTR